MSILHIVVIYKLCIHKCVDSMVIESKKNYVSFVGYLCCLKYLVQKMFSFKNNAQCIEHKSQICWLILKNKF